MNCFSIPRDPVYNIIVHIKFIRVLNYFILVTHKVLLVRFCYKPCIEILCFGNFYCPALYLNNNNNTRIRSYIAIHLIDIAVAMHIGTLCTKLICMHINSKYCITKTLT